MTTAATATIDSQWYDSVRDVEITVDDDSQCGEELYASFVATVLPLYHRLALVQFRAQQARTTTVVCYNRKSQLRKACAELERRVFAKRPPQPQKQHALDGVSARDSKKRRLVDMHNNVSAVSFHNVHVRIYCNADDTMARSLGASFADKQTEQLILFQGHCYSKQFIFRQQNEWVASLRLIRAPTTSSSDDVRLTLPASIRKVSNDEADVARWQSQLKYVLWKFFITPNIAHIHYNGSSSGVLLFTMYDEVERDRSTYANSQKAYASLRAVHKSIRFDKDTNEHNDAAVPLQKRRRHANGTVPAVPARRYEQVAVASGDEYEKIDERLRMDAMDRSRTLRVYLCDGSALYKLCAERQCAFDVHTARLMRNTQWRDAHGIYPLLGVFLLQWLAK